MAPNPTKNDALKARTQNTKTSQKSSFWKLLCPCLSSKNSDSDEDDKMKDSYMREEFYEEKTHNEQNIHQETQTNLPIEFKIPGFLLQNHPNPKYINQNPIKNDSKLTTANRIKFNIKKNNTLQGYLNENRNPNIQLSKQSNNGVSHDQNSRFQIQKPKNQQLGNKKYKEQSNKQNTVLQTIDYKKMRKDHKYLLRTIKQLSKKSAPITDGALLENDNEVLDKKYPINMLQQNKLIVIGEKNHKLLAKVTSAKIYSSVTSVQKLKESLENKEADAKIIKKDENFNRALDKFWQKRYFLFEKFDEGIQLDQQSWYSVTPQSVADYISSRINVKNVILDAFCGAGGDSLKLAGSCGQIISNDIDSVKLKCLFNNAKIYDVQNIALSNLDFFKLNVKVDAVYLAPPWGGPDYFKIASFHPEDFEPKLTDIIQKAFTLSTNIFLLLPINTNIEALAAVINQKICKINNFKPESCSMRIQKLFYNDSLKFLLVLFGDSSLISDIKLGDELSFIYDMFRQDDQTYFKYKKLIRKIREEYGMIKLLNSVFEAQNFFNQAVKNQWKVDQVSTIEKFQNYLLKNQLIDEKILSKIKEQQQKQFEYDLKHRSEKNKRLKQKKIKKFLQKQGKNYKKDEKNEEEFLQEIDQEENQAPLTQIIKKTQTKNHQNFNRKETFDSNIDIQSSIQESFQMPGRDSLRTVSIISEFQQDQLRNINHTERGTNNSELSVRDSIHPIQKFDDFQVSIDSRSKISEESGRMMPNSAQKSNEENFMEQTHHRFSEPIMFFKKEEIRMKKLKAREVYEKGISDQISKEKEF